MNSKLRFNHTIIFYKNIDPCETAIMQLSSGSLEGLKPLSIYDTTLSIVISMSQLLSRIFYLGVTHRCYMRAQKFMELTLCTCMMRLWHIKRVSKQ